VTRTGFVLASAAAFVLVSCGGENDRLSKPAYEEKVRAVYAQVQDAFAATNVTEPGELADRVEAAQDEVREAADELEGITPPAEAEAANAQIAAGLKLYGDELDVLREAAEQGDQRAIDDFNARIANRESIRQIAEAAESLKFKGYDLGPIAEE
jgi:hypothetical protein